LRLAAICTLPDLGKEAWDRRSRVEFQLRVSRPSSCLHVRLEEGRCRTTAATRRPPPTTKISLTYFPAQAALSMSLIHIYPGMRVPSFVSHEAPSLYEKDSRTHTRYSYPHQHVPFHGVPPRTSSGPVLQYSPGQPRRRDQSRRRRRRGDQPRWLVRGKDSAPAGLMRRT
jgi:hypothetical protein